MQFPYAYALSCNGIIYNWYRNGIIYNWSVCNDIGIDSNTVTAKTLAEFLINKQPSYAESTNEYTRILRWWTNSNQLSYTHTLSALIEPSKSDIYASFCIVFNWILHVVFKSAYSIFAVHNNSLNSSTDSWLNRSLWMNESRVQRIEWMRIFFHDTRQNRRLINLK